MPDFAEPNHACLASAYPAEPDLAISNFAKREARRA